MVVLQSADAVGRVGLARSMRGVVRVSGEEAMTERRHHAVLIAILLLGLLVRLAPWGHNRFLEDEALYATWALQIATGADPMLDEEPVDKPPLHPYTLAVSFLLSSLPGPSGTGPGHETAARLPSLLASLASIALVYALAEALYREKWTGLMAALLLALSPYDLLFASTAFTDPLMTAWALAALLAAAKNRPGLAGLLVGLAAATKQQGLFFLPLIIALTALAPGSPARAETRSAARISSWLRKAWRSRWLRFGLGFGLIVAGALWWDAARLQRPGFLAQSLLSYGGLGPAEPQALGERAVEWLRLVAAFWVSPWFNGLALGALVAWAAGGLAGWWSGPNRIDLALGLFVLAYVVLHWLLGFQIWDRYLLGLVPLVAVLGARALVGLGQAVRSVPGRRAFGAVLSVVLIVTLAGPVLQATRSELPIGGDHGAYDGIEQLAQYMRTQVRQGSVLYHYWLGYHYRFYLYGAALRLHWYPDLEDLVQDATIYRREPRYIAVPSWQDTAPLEAALTTGGIQLVPALQTIRRDGTVSFRLYRLEGP
jgi:4-amino-4-deoxy-L-arabinose transferase-like glycosyltransferase